MTGSLFPFRYPVPAAEASHEIEIRRSRFRATVAPAPTVDDARAFIQRLRATHADATHNCWAYLVGPPGTSDRIGMSDDGEPHGTAGRPMLNVLSHSGIGDVAVVVTRWFGGTKLGAGGLVRAYGDATQQVLERMPRGERIDWITLSVSVAYAAVDPLRRILPEYEAEILDEQWTEQAGVVLRLPSERRSAFVERLTELTNGRATVSEA